MLTKELRIGNFVFNKKDNNSIPLNISQIRLLYDMETLSERFICPIKITDEWLLNFGFIKVERESYINGFQYLKQINGHHDDIATEGIDRDGTWFDGIGTFSYKKTGNLVVNTLCRGNYVCGSVEYVHQLQNLYFALTGVELVKKSNLGIK